MKIILFNTERLGRRIPTGVPLIFVPYTSRHLRTRSPILVSHFEILIHPKTDKDK